MTQKKQKPVIPKPRKEVPCPASPDPDEAGRNYAMQGHLIFQAASDVVHIGWTYKNMEEVIDVIAQG